MSRWSLGLFVGAKGNLSSVYVTKDGVPMPYEQKRVGGRPIVFHAIYNGMTFSQARQQLLADAAAAGVDVSATAPALHAQRLRTGLDGETRVARAKVHARVPKKSSPTIALRERALRGKFELIIRKGRSKNGGRVKVPRDHITRMAALETIAGDLAPRVHAALVQLFFHRDRLANWGAGLAAIPPEREYLGRLAENVEGYGEVLEVTGNDAIRKQRFGLVQVIEVMMEVQDPVAYVEHGKRSGLTQVGALYHPNTLKVAKNLLRGAFGPLARNMIHDRAKPSRVRVVSD